MDTYTIRFRALLKMTGETPVENGQLVVERGRIKNIDTNQRGPVEGELVDLSGSLLLPGFVNAHCHLALSALKGRIPRRERFTDWVRSLIDENEKVSWENRVITLHAQAKEMARSGVTALADHLSQAELVTEYTRLPFRQTLFLEVLGFHPSLAGSVVERLEPVLKRHPSNNGSIRWGLAPHAPYSVSPKLFGELKRLASHYNCPLSCHVAELPEEVKLLKDGVGDIKDLLVERGMFDDSWTPPDMSPVRYLDSLGVLDSLVTVHLNLAGDDLDLLASKNVKAVFCPQSTRWFRRGRYMPVRKLLDRGVVVGLGTDSLASNESLNFLGELRVAEEMLADVAREELLYMATRGGAEVLGMDCGAIENGRPADLIGFNVEGGSVDWVGIPFDPERTGADFIMVGGKRVF
jgi:cytosine/adenosine deaminase-related metal-dependent hydrolase